MTSGSNTVQDMTILGLYHNFDTVPVCLSPWQENVADGGWNVQNWVVRETPTWRR